MAEKKKQEQSKIGFDEAGRFKERRELLDNLLRVNSMSWEMVKLGEQIINWEKQHKSGNIQVLSQQGKKINKIQLREELKVLYMKRKSGEKQLLYVKEDIVNTLKGYDLDVVKNQIKEHFEKIESESFKIREKLHDVI